MDVRIVKPMAKSGDAPKDMHKEELYSSLNWGAKMFFCGHMLR